MRLIPMTLGALVLATALASAAAVAHQSADAQSAPMAMQSDTHPAAPNYDQPSAWACFPGNEDRCTSGMDAVALDASGHRTAVPFSTATNPAIDCFYVYPTASRAQQDYADIDPSPAVMNAVRLQAGRLASRCRLFAPLYRQATLRHLHAHSGSSWDGPYLDIEAAWAWYLAHENHGRGVVLIGHSQGTILLQRLIAEHIDGTADQKRLVAAFLIGNPGLEVPKGKTVGGTFQHVPLCTSATSTGCVYSWASYAANDDAPRVFGLNRSGMTAACTNPAMPGATGLLDAVFPGKYVPDADRASFVEFDKQLKAQCVDDAQGSVLRISVLPGANAQTIQNVLDRSAIKGTAFDWGLHVIDVALAQGSILQLIDAESAQWQRMAH